MRIWSSLLAGFRPKPKLNGTWPIYQVGEAILVPHVLRTAGPSVEVRPFRILRSTDPSLRTRLTEILQEENVRRADLDLRNFHLTEEKRLADKEFLKALHVRSWTQLYRSCRLWQVAEQGGVFKVQRWKVPADKRGMEPDTGGGAVWDGLSLDAAVDCLLAELRTQGAPSDA